VHCGLLAATQLDREALAVLLTNKQLAAASQCRLHVRWHHTNLSELVELSSAIHSILVPNGLSAWCYTWQQVYKLAFSLDSNEADHQQQQSTGHGHVGHVVSDSERSRFRSAVDAIEWIFLLLPPYWQPIALCHVMPHSTAGYMLTRALNNF
jgi:hypothetical protein